MKTSIALAVLILALGTGIGSRDQHRLSRARELHEKLTNGTSARSPAEDSPTSSSSKHREQRKPEVRAKFVLEGYLAYLRDYKTLGAGGGNPEIVAAVHERYMELMAQVKCLSAEELKLLIAESRTNPEVAGRNFSRTIIQKIAENRPALALGFLSEETDQGPKSLMGDSNFIESSIKTWSKDDPAAALAWVRKYKGTFPLNSIERVNYELIRGVATRDPQAAFRLLGEMKKGDPVEQGFYSVMDECKTPEQLSAALSGLPEYLKTIEDENKKAVIKGQAKGWLAFSASKTGFESGTKWIESANLSAEEIEDFSSNLGGNIDHIKNEDVAKWAQWIWNHSAADGGDKSVRNFMEGWARNDYRAAAEWIKAAPDGPSKNSSVRAYAELVSEYEPETAVPWADSLPAGSERDATLKTIRKNWAKKDAEGAAAFALKYGIR